MKDKQKCWMGDAGDHHERWAWIGQRRILMLKKYCTVGMAGALLLAATGCENLPGDEKAQGATIGGVTGAAVGAAVGGENKLLGALLGGAIGAGGGYLIGANWDKITGKDSEGAQA